jgi:hypothetical protein
VALAGTKTAGSEGSSPAEDEAEKVVSLAEDCVEQNNRKGQKCAVSLDGIGPRMEIRLMKFTEAMSGRKGAVIYHEFGTSWFVASSVTLEFVELLCFYPRRQNRILRPKRRRALFRKS